MPTAVENIPTADEKKVSASANNESGPENKNIIMPTATAAIITCQPTDEKKRKEATASNNDERSGPQKKRLRKLCSSEGCANITIKGGVCVRHGAKRRRCSFDGCPNQVRRRGVCYRHGAYPDGTPRKQCSSEGCVNQAKKGGVCFEHGCNFGRCNTIAIYGGFCWRHRPRSGAPLARAAVQRGYIQGGGNQTVAATEISDDEDGEKKQSSIASQKRKAGSDKQSETNCNGTGGDGPVNELEQEITGNKDAATEREKGNSSTVGGENLNDDEEQDASGMMPRKRTRGEVNLKDDKEQNIQVENNLGRDDGNTVSATQISDNGEGGTQPRGVDRKGKAAEKQSNKLTSNDSVGEEGLFKRHGANGGDRRYQQQNNHSFPSSLINVNAEQQQHGDGNQQPTPNERINMNIAGFKSNSEIIRELKSKLSCSRMRGAMEYHEAYVKLCSVEGCTTMAICGEFCWMHRSYAAEPLAQANVQPGHIQGGGNQNNLSTTVEILSDDDDGEKKQSPIVRRKQEVVSGKQQSGTSTFNDAEDKEPGESDQEITGNKDTVEDRKMDGSVKSLVKRRANLKDDEEEDTLGMMPRKRTQGEHVILFDRL